MRTCYHKFIYVYAFIQESLMVVDRHRWRLHGTANQDIDLQAWYVYIVSIFDFAIRYHALFYKEVYRLRYLTCILFLHIYAHINTYK